ncbi:unnamed protein product [Clonostachys rosea]|uniref:Uncharacterized protein n=1 Tax=Bionectria ochroleuca TaxID=29856 RepID=A0ABY6TYU3_BIOOC|nr:unnamed protein product [Clonostachys rosea]
MAPSTRKRRQAVDTAGVQSDHEDDAPEDERRDDKQFFEEAKGQKKRKVTIQIAKAEIDGHVKDVLAFIEEKEKAIIGANLDPGHCPTLSPDLDSIVNFGRQSNIHNPTFQRTKDALDRFRNMIIKCQAPEKYEESITKPRGSEWEQDKRNLESLDEHASLMATRLICSLIVPNPSPSLKNPPDPEDGIARMAWEFFTEEMSGMAKDTWGRIAQEQVKSFTHVLRSMEKN